MTENKRWVIPYMISRWSLANMKQHQEILSRRSEHGEYQEPPLSPLEVLNRQMEKLKVEMTDITKREQKSFELFLQDLKTLLPKNLSREKAVTFVNLLNDVHFLWGAGKMEVIEWSKKRILEKAHEANPKKDPRIEVLRETAKSIQKFQNERVVRYEANMKKGYMMFLEGTLIVKHNQKLERNSKAFKNLSPKTVVEHRELLRNEWSEIPERAKKLYSERKFWEYRRKQLKKYPLIAEGIRQISFPEALRLANERYEIFSEGEFKRNEKKIYEATRRRRG